jgi:hypothetical protein
MVLVVITYAFPADGRSRGLTTHSLGLVEVSFFIRSCQLVALDTSNPVEVTFVQYRGPKSIQAFVKVIV